MLGSSLAVGQDSDDVAELKKIIALQQEQINDLMTIVNTVVAGDRWIGSPSGLKGDTGPKGATGPKGPKGDRGVKGPKGDRGATGAGCSVASVSGGVKITCAGRSKVVKNGSQPYKYETSNVVAVPLKNGLWLELGKSSYCLYGKRRSDGSRPKIWCN